MEHRVAILGGSGFIGRYVVKRLAERGDVVAVGARNAAAAKFLKLKGDVGQVGLLNIALDDERLLPAFLAGNHAVVNCVGILQERGAQRFDRVHHTAPARLARLAREAGTARFIHVSAIVCLDPRWTRTVPSPQRPHAQRRHRAATAQPLTPPECAHPDTVEPGL